MIFGWIYGVFCSSICSWGWHIMAFYALRYVESVLRCWHCWQWFPGIPFPSCPMLPGRGLLFIAWEAVPLSIVWQTTVILGWHVPIACRICRVCAVPFLRIGTACVWRLPDWLPEIIQLPAYPCATRLSLMPVSASVFFPTTVGETRTLPVPSQLIICISPRGIKVG